MFNDLLTSPILPQAILLLMVCFILLFAAFFPNNKYGVYALAQLALLVSAWSYTWAPAAAGHIHYFLHNALMFDRLGSESSIIILLLVFICFIFSRQYNDENSIPTQEFYILALLSTLGMLVLVSAANLLSLYLGIELMSLPMYALIALKRDESRCLESAIKYFIIGALASGLLLFGFSFLFGITGSLSFVKIQQFFVSTPLVGTSLVTFALILVISAMLFKLGAVPFHSWVADVYDGAPNGVTLFIAGAPKVAIMVVLIRLLLSPLHSFYVQWQPVLEVAAVLSIALGNLAAIAQTNIKRMLAYSSISHMGYALLGLCAAGVGIAHGYSAAFFYIVCYAFMSVGAFGFLVMMSRFGKEVRDIKDLTGLSNSQPWMAFMFLLLMFSMAGIPPLIGFMAKITILERLIQAHLVWLAVYAIIFAIVGAFYYIRIVKVMYFEKPEFDCAEQPVYAGQESFFAVTIVATAVLFVGLLPGALISICRAII